MNRVDRIVELIDHALDDHAASGDAMRWTPEPVPDPIAGVDYTVTLFVDTSACVEALDAACGSMRWTDGIVWNPGPPIMVNCGEMVVCETAEREDGMWLTLRPLPPAESVYIDLSVWD